MIYTSYFAGYRGTKGVAVCLYKPQWWKGEQFLDLAPTERILKWWNESPKDEKTKRIYRKLYCRDVLEHLNVHDVARALEGKVLLCYEKPDEFCHRHIIAEWLNANGYKCEEFDLEKILYGLIGEKLKII